MKFLRKTMKIGLLINKSKKSFYLLFIAFFVASCGSLLTGSYEDLVEKMGVKVPDEKDYPDYDAVVLFEDKESKLDYESGLVTYETFHTVKKVFKNVEEYAEGVVYLSDYEKLLEIAARTIKPDGTILKVAESEFFTIMPDIASGASVDGSRIVKFTYPHVSNGCILELKYKKVVFSFFSGDRWIVQNQDMPTLKNRYSLSVSKLLVMKPIDGGYGINWIAKPYSFANYPKPNQIRTAGDYARTEWVIENIPAFKSERKMPPYLECISNVRFVQDDLRTWEEVGELYSSMFFKGYVVSDKTKAKAIELTKGLNTTIEKLNALFEFVRKIRYFNVSLGSAGYVPALPDYVVEKNYGDCKDKAMLLITLLKSIGIDSDPALVLTKEKGNLDLSFPAGGGFNHVIVKVKTDGETIWVDPTSRFTKLKELPIGDQGVMALVLYKDKKSEFVLTPSSTPSDNTLTNNIYLTVNDDFEVVVSMEIEATGFQETFNRYRFHDVKDKDIKDYLKQSYGGELKDIEIDSVQHTDPDDLNTPFKFSFSYKIKEIIQKVGDMYLMDLTTFDLLPRMDWLSEKERKFDIINNYIYEDYSNIEIKFNNNKLKIKNLPPTETIKDPSYSYKRSFLSDGSDVISGGEMFACKSLLINKNRYSDLKDYFSKLKKASNEKIVFEEIK